MVSSDQTLRAPSFLSLTTDGMEPSCASDADNTGGLIKGDQDVNVLIISLESSATVRAVVCQQGFKGAEAAASFVVRESPAVLLSFSLDVESVSDVTEDIRNAVRSACAKALGVDQERVTIQSVADARRRLLTVTIEVRILTKSGEEATRLVQMAMEGLEQEMESSQVPMSKGSLVAAVQVCMQPCSSYLFLRNRSNLP